MKKSLSVVSVILMFMTLICAFPLTSRATGSISVGLRGESSVKAGDGYDVLVNLTDISAVSGGGIYGASLSVSYDKQAFSFIGASLAGESGWTISSDNTGSAVKIECSDQSSAKDQPVISTGTFCTLHFETKDDAQKQTADFRLNGVFMADLGETETESRTSLSQSASVPVSAVSSTVSEAPKLKEVYARSESLSVKVMSNSTSNVISDLLSSLYVSYHSISPKFSPWVTSYTVSVPNNVSSVRIHATPKDSTATVSFSGNYKSLDVGYNTATVTVTARDGSHKVYTLIIVRFKPNEDVIDSAALAAYLAQHSIPTGSADSQQASNPAKQTGGISIGGGGFALGQLLLLAGAIICIGGVATSVIILRKKRL